MGEAKVGEGSITTNDHHRGDRIDVVEGPVGSARLKDPAEVASSSADLETLPLIEEDDASGKAEPGR